VAAMSPKAVIIFHALVLLGVGGGGRKLHEARVECRHCKSIDESLSIKFRSQLAEAKEATGTIKATVHLRNMNRIEAIITLFRNIQYMEGKMRAGASAQLTITNADGSLSELTDKEDVEKAIIQSNKQKYHQTEGGSQLLEPFLTRGIGTFGDGPRVIILFQTHRQLLQPDTGIKFEHGDSARKPLHSDIGNFDLVARNVNNNYILLTGCHPPETRRK